jgi:putative intracellular protease/amidase
MRANHGGMKWSTVGRAALVTFVAFAMPVAVAAFGIARATEEIYTNRDASAPRVSVDAVTAPAHDPAKPTAVIVLSLQGTNIADVSAPYEVLADTGAFNLYTIAERREPVPLTGGVDLVPDMSFTQLNDRLRGAPDVIIVPQLHDSAESSSVLIEHWLQQQRAEGDPLLVSVCVGAEVFASAGLLDGRPATSHWLKLIDLRRKYPAVQWQDGVRYVDDGDVITAAGVLSGVVLRCGSWSGRSARRRRSGRRRRSLGQTIHRVGRRRSRGYGRHRLTPWAYSVRRTAGTAPIWECC